MNDTFPGADYSYNDEMVGGISKYLFIIHVKKNFKKIDFFLTWRELTFFCGYSQINETDPEKLIKLFKKNTYDEFQVSAMVVMFINQPKRYHVIFIHNICPYINIMTPRIISRNKLLNMSIMYVENMNIPWAKQNVHIVAKNSIIYVRNSKIQEK